MKYFALILFSVIFTSCDKDSKYLYQYDPEPVKKEEKSIPIKTLAVDGNIDILWVIDNSGSMQAIQNNIIANARIFMEQFVLEKHINWKMGIVSTDKSESPYLGFDSSFDRSLVDFNDPQSIGATVVKFQDAVRDLGTSGDASELVFYNVLRAITEYDGKIRPAFLRPNSHLAVIMVTDEEEQSAKRMGSSYSAPAFLNTLTNFISTNKTLRFYGAFDFKDLQDCGGTWSEEYAGSPFEEVINFTGGFHVSACISDFGSKLVEIGKDIASLVKLPSLLLKHIPKVHTLKVFYRGEELPSGSLENGGMWYYDTYNNTINFYSMDFVIDVENDTFDIKYDISDGITRPGDPVYDN